MDSTSKSAVRVTALLFILLTPGCAGVGRTPSGGPPASAAPQAQAVGAAPAAPSPAMPTAPKDQSAAKAGAAASTSPAKAPAPGVQPRKESAAAAPSKQAGPAPLDLVTLETRLKETQAIGVLTKIRLKNEIDDLLGRFRAFYEGQQRTTLTELRQGFETLFLKVLSLIQDSDPSLAKSISASREAIWGILSDRGKFSTL